MKRTAHLAAGCGLALTLALGAWAEGDHPQGAAEDKGKVTEPCGDGKDGTTVVERTAHENQKHDARLAKLARLEHVAKDGNNDALLAQVARMRDKENLRHARALNRLAALDEGGNGKVEQAKQAKDKAKEMAKAKKREKAKGQAPGG